jgi:hypothetical protein
VAFDRRVLAVAGLAFAGSVFGNRARVFRHREEAVLLFAASRMVSVKKIKGVGGVLRTFLLEIK